MRSVDFSGDRSASGGCPGLIDVLRAVGSVPRLRLPRRSIPWGFLGMLVLLPAIEARLERLARRHAAPAVRDWQGTRKAIAGDLRAYPLLCFGDSQVKTGVNPGVLEARTGLRAYNLALIGGQAPSTYCLLRRALAGGARPRAIVVDFLPPLLAADFGRNARTFPELLSFAEAAELAWVRKEASEFLRLATAIALPSLRARLDLRKALATAWRGRHPPRHDASFVRRSQRLHQGAVLLPRQPLREDAATWYDANYSRPWTCHPVNAWYLDRLLALAAERRIAVYWLIHPIAAAAQAYCEQKGQDARYERFVRAAIARYPNVIVVDGRHSDYGDAAFVDTVHLHGDAAGELSNDLSRALLGPLRIGDAADRWIALGALGRKSTAGIAAAVGDGPRIGSVAGDEPGRGGASPLTPVRDMSRLAGRRPAH